MLLLFLFISFLSYRQSQRKFVFITRNERKIKLTTTTMMTTTAHNSIKSCFENVVVRFTFIRSVIVFDATTKLKYLLRLVYRFCFITNFYQCSAVSVPVYPLNRMLSIHLNKRKKKNDFFRKNCLNSRRLSATHRHERATGAGANTHIC